MDRWPQNEAPDGAIEALDVAVVWGHGLGAATEEDARRARLWALRREAQNERCARYDERDDVPPRMGTFALVRGGVDTPVHLETIVTNGRCHVKASRQNKM